MSAGRPQDRAEHSVRRLFRTSRPADGPVIQAIFTEAGLNLPLEDPAGGRCATVPDLFVCEANGEIVAALHWRSILPEGEILDIAVKTGHRRRGHASFVMKQFLQHAASLGIQKIFLEVRESNAAAIALYKKIGFTSIGRRTNYYRHPDESALLMELVLPG